MADNAFTPALIVVDVQEDFCPPNGSLAVPEGRDVVEPINKLLALPFALKVATKDWHPRDHVSFAANHAGKQPFVDFATIVHPDHDASAAGDADAESYESRLWPVHCVQGTFGATLVDALDAQRIDAVIEKGTDARFEMYSPFYAPFISPPGSSSLSSSSSQQEEQKMRVGDSGLAALLRKNAVTDVYVVGLAGDYCVKACAEDAVREGFRTYLIEEATRAVDPGSWPRCRAEIEGSGARVVSLHGPEVARLRGE
ncbi:isochorismatase [Nemania sp. FL0916]|nr:isochorismatase [Nemania sp. FL0916]